MPAPLVIFVIAFLLLPGPHAPLVAQAAEMPDGLAATRSLARAGALDLALRRIDMLQPQDSKGASSPGASFWALWAEWEILRLQLLARLDRNDEVLRRAAAIPAEVPAAARGGLHVIAAHAALALGRPATARNHAGRALWIPNPDAGTLRELRLLVIRSHVRDARADDAYRSMLRFEQDYRPLDAATADIFVGALLDLKMTKEAVAWLNQLDDRGPAKLRLRLHTGVVTPQDAVTLARAALGRSNDPAWWRILLEAADRQHNGVLRIAALEQLLDLPAADVGQPDVEAGRLWEAYAAHARNAANIHQLLAGDDAQWLEFALRRRGAEPAEARAYLAFLLRHARDPKLQQNAQAQLAADFAAAKLPRAGLRMFTAWPADAGELAPSARHGLGVLAETAGNPQRQLQYWQGLPAPANMPATVWTLRLSALALRAGRAEIAADLARPLAADRAAIPVAQLPEWLALAQQFSEHGLHDPAQALFERLLPQADAAQQRRVLSGIARSYEARGQPQLAADFYLRSAVGAPKEVSLGGAPAADASAAEARLLAGFSLARAGMLEDARAQFQWVMKNGEPGQIAVARRELGF